MTVLDRLDRIEKKLDNLDKDMELLLHYPQENAKKLDRILKLVEDELA